MTIAPDIATDLVTPLGAYLRLDGTVGSSSGYGGVSLGLAYRL